MARNKKCRYCGNEITYGSANEVFVGNRKFYFCDNCKEENFKYLNYNKMKSIIGLSGRPKVLEDKLNDLYKMCKPSELNECIKNRENTIQFIIDNKLFDSEYRKTLYSVAVVKNQMKDYLKQLQERKYMKKDTEFVASKYKRKYKRTPLKEYERGEIDNE